MVIKAAARAPGAVVGEFLRCAETGTDTTTLSDSLSPGGTALTLRNQGFGPDSSALRPGALTESKNLYIRAAAHLVDFIGVFRNWDLTLPVLTFRRAILDHVPVGSFTVGTEALACDFSLSGSPDPIEIVAAAGAPGAVVFNLLNSAETGTNIGAMLGGFVEGGVVDACGNMGFVPDTSAPRAGRIESRNI